MAIEPQSQQLGAGAKGLQAGRDATDNSVSVSYTQIIEQEKRDYGIIEEILNCLFSANLGDLNLEESLDGKGLKKNDINLAPNARTWPAQPAAIGR